MNRSPSKITGLAKKSRAQKGKIHITCHAKSDATKKKLDSCEHHQYQLQHLLSSQFPFCLNLTMAFSRSVLPFLRTARSALQQGNSVSPLQHALRRQNGASVLNAARTYATAFERTKPHVNIGLSSSADSIAVVLMRFQVQLGTLITAR